MVYILVNYQNKKNVFIINLLNSVYSEKIQICNKLNINYENILFRYKTKNLENNKTFKYYNIKEGDIIYITNKTNGGNSIGKILLLILGIFFFIFYFIFMFLGLLPIFANLIASIILTSFGALDSFIQTFNTNNIIKKFINLNFVRFMLRFFKFIISYGSLFIFGAIVTFLAVFLIYNFRFKNDFCKGFNNAYFVGLITSMVFTMFYILNDLPMLMVQLFGDIIGRKGVIAKLKIPIIKISKKISNLIKKIQILFIPYIGSFYEEYLNGFNELLNGIAYVQQEGEILISNFPLFIKMMELNPLFQMKVKEYGLTPINNMIHYTYMSPDEQNKASYELSEVRGAYIIRWIIDNIMSIFLVISFILNGICPSIVDKQIQDDIGTQTDKLYELTNLIKDQSKNGKLTKKTFKELNSRIKDINSKISVLQEKKNKAQETELINVTGIQNFVECGVFSFPVPIIIFLVIFIIKIIK